MKTVLKTSFAAAGLALLAAPPAAFAQSAESAAVELAEMRRQLAAMQARISALEAELATQEIAPERAAASEDAVAPDSPTASFKGAPEIETASGWSFKPRGRLQYDAGIVNVPDATGRDEGFGSEARRARLGVTGDMPAGFGYKFEVDFAGNDVEINDAILTYDAGDLSIALGQHNNFQSLEELSSSLHISMLERAAFTDAFGFERRVGLSAEYGGDSVIAQVGVFTDNIGDLSNRNFSVDGRVVAMPRLGAAQLHIGGSAHYASYEDGSTVRYRQRPQVHFTSERFVNTGAIPAEAEIGFGMESAAILGRLHAAAEGFWQTVERPGALTDATFFGGYAEVGVFLTDDRRGYKGGKFDRTKPSSPVGEGGLGAVQLNLRYDYLDLNDGAILGGQQNAYLASLVWTPTDYTRFMLNYGRIEFDDTVFAGPFGSRSYSADVFGMRGQIDF